MNQVVRLRRRKGLEIIETPEFVDLQQRLGMLAEKGGLALVMGKVASGKTFSMERFAEANPKTAIMVEAPSALEYGPMGFMDQVARACGSYPSGVSRQDVSAQVVEALSEGRILLLDEATHLPTRALDWLRRLPDRSGGAVVLAGLPRLWHRMRQYLPEIRSRLAWSKELQGMPRSAVDRLAPALSEEIREVLWRQTGGEWRAALEAIRWACRFQETNGRELAPREMNEYLVKRLVLPAA